MPAMYINPSAPTGAVLLFGNQNIEGIKTFLGKIMLDVNSVQDAASENALEIVGSRTLGTLFKIRESDHTNLLSVNSAGVTSSKGVTAQFFTATSSREKKKDISDYTDSAIDLINKVKVVKFKYLDDKSDTVRIGFIAEDTPIELSDDYKHYDIDNCVGVLLKSVQELSERVSFLEGRIKELEG